jgi:hypothetical protein
LKKDYIARGVEWYMRCTSAFIAHTFHVQMTGLAVQIFMSTGESMLLVFLALQTQLTSAVQPLVLRRPTSVSSRQGSRSNSSLRIRNCIPSLRI